MRDVLGGFSKTINGTGGAVMKFHLAKQGNRFIPMTEEDQIKAYKIGQGEVIEAKAVDQRNVQHHRKFFALINIVWDNMPEKYDNYFPTPEALRKELIKRAGYFETYTDLKGTVQHIPKSIAFNKMGQSQFDDLYSKVLDVIVKWFDFDREVLESEIVGFF